MPQRAFRHRAFEPEKPCVSETIEHAQRSGLVEAPVTVDHDVHAWPDGMPYREHTLDAHIDGALRGGLVQRLAPDVVEGCDLHRSESLRDGLDRRARAALGTAVDRCPVDVGVHPHLSATLR